MPDVEESESELYGTNPRVIALLITIVTLVVPFGYIPPGTDIILYIQWYHLSGIYGLLWFIGADLFAPIGFHGFHFLEFGLTVLTVGLSIFHLLFALQLVRYYQGKTSQNRVILIGGISLLFPTLLTILSTGMFLPVSITRIPLPIPIQFAIGLILLFKVPGPELIESSIE